MEAPVTLLKTFSREEAERVAAALKQRQIPCNVEAYFAEESVITGRELEKNIVVRVSRNDLEQANALLREIADNNPEALPEDYYLFQFTDDELTDLLIKEDEWNHRDVVWAKRILQQRGITLSEQTIRQKQAERIARLRQPGKPATMWIAIGYITALLGGPLGACIGWYLMYARKTLPTGEKVWAYAAPYRLHGKIIFIVACVVIAGCLTATLLHHAQLLDVYR